MNGMLRNLTIKAGFGEQIHQIAADISLRIESACRRTICDGAVMPRGIPINPMRVVVTGATDVVDRETIVPAPEKRCECESLVRAKHVTCGKLALALSDYPVFDTYAANTRIGPGCNVTSSEHVRCGRLERRVDNNTVADRDTGFLCKRYFGPHADTDHHKICRERSAVGKCNTI